MNKKKIGEFEYKGGTSGDVRVSDLVFLKSLLSVFERFRLRRISLSYCYEFFGGRFNLRKNEVRLILRRLDALGFIHFNGRFIEKRFKISEKFAHSPEKVTGSWVKGDKKE